MTKQEAIQIIRDVVECYIDINHNLTSCERAEVIELIDDMENQVTEHYLNMEETMTVINEIKNEQMNQVAKWGIQEHDPSYWMVILMEEVGEACSEICGMKTDLVKYREELIQVAAVTKSAIESLDRQENKPNDYDTYIANH